MRIRAPHPATGAPSTPAPPRPAAPKAKTVAPVQSWPGSEIMHDKVLARTLFHVWSNDPGVVVESPPGAGKTRLVVLLAQQLAHRGGQRVAIAAQTRAQALEITGRLAGGTDLAQLMWKQNTAAPGTGGIPVVTGADAQWPRRGGGIIVGVTARWLHSEPDHLGADVLIVDEAWQSTWADFGALSALAEQVVAVGDPGQIAPVVTGVTSRWAGSPTAPNLPAPQALLAAHPDAVGLVQLEHTWRLGPDTTALVQPVFYPDLKFGSRRPLEYLIDPGGARLPELARQPVAPIGGHTDPALVGVCADRARALLSTRLVTRDETRPLTGEDIAVIVPHVSQASAIEAALSDIPGILVGTANALQGLERPAAVVLHPMAGYREAHSFAMEPGRVCVMLSRHRAHATVVYDTSTPTTLLHAEPGAAQALNLTLIDTLTALPDA